MPIDAQGLALPEYGFELRTPKEGTVWQLNDQSQEGGLGGSEIKLHFRRKSTTTGSAAQIRCVSPIRGCVLAASWRLPCAAFPCPAAGLNKLAGLPH